MQGRCRGDAGEIQGRYRGVLHLRDVDAEEAAAHAEEAGEHSVEWQVLARLLLVEGVACHLARGNG